MSLIILTVCTNKQKDSMDTLIIHYHRYDQQYDDWSLWTWLDDVTHEIPVYGRDTFGLIFKLNISKYPIKGNINFLPKYKDWERKDAPDRHWIRTTPNEIWILQGIETIYFEKPSTEPFVRRAFLDGIKDITVLLTKPVKKSELLNLKAKVIFKNNEIVEPAVISFKYDTVEVSDVLRLTTKQRIDITKLPAKIELRGYKAGDLFLRGVLDSTEYFSDEPLGVFLEEDKTKFAVYAPGAKKVELNLYSKPTGGDAEIYQLARNKHGVWHTTLDFNAVGKYYTYSADGLDLSYKPGIEVIDPYVRSVTKHNGRGLITDEKTRVSDSPVFQIKDAVIYEMHVRDFTIGSKSGVENKGRYLGFAESGTVIPRTNISTGLDHLVELGINTVQLMPVQDFEHNGVDYFWGYMPVNFNSPEGWYATKTDDDSRIREFKLLVDALHKKGIKVVMDVVYNHTAEGSPNVRYNFNGLVPNFYYRQRIDGSYWNGSGCGNEVRSENRMVRRFIVESLKYWVEEYKIDGFRFDLMGLHDMDTMREIVQTLKSIKPDIFIYGEPWTAGETPIKPTLKGSQRGEGFAVFNDHFRDALKGPWYNLDPGFIQKGINISGVKKGIIGSITDFADSPQEVINYVVCHDGRTLWDHLKATMENDKNITDEQFELMDKLAAAILFTSQGVPFIHGGQEFLRSKFGSHNSYNQPDSINMVRWELKQKNYDIFKYYQGLIKLRNEHPMFKMTSAQQINKNLIFLETKGLNAPQNSIAYQISSGISGDSWKKVIVLINPNYTEQDFQIPSGNWKVVVNQKQAGTNIIKTVSKGHVRIKGISAMVLYQ